MAGYSGTPLARKLGLVPGASMLLDGAPEEFDLCDLPGEVRVSRRLGKGPYDLILCFCPDYARLEGRWPVLHPRTTIAGALWIAWPKRTSGVKTDLAEPHVRERGLALGIVDYKICAIDETWSGLLFARRRGR